LSAGVTIQLIRGYLDLWQREPRHLKWRFNFCPPQSDGRNS